MGGIPDNDADSAELTIPYISILMLIEWESFFFVFSRFLEFR